MVDAVVSTLTPGTYDHAIACRLGYEKCLVYYNIIFQNKESYNEWIPMIQGIIAKLHEIKANKTTGKL